MSYSLVDCIERSKLNKESFEIPDAEDIAKLKVGDHVILIFENIGENDTISPSGERMWVLITEVNANKFKGTLDNYPAFIENLKYQDVIEFEAKHICNLNHH